MIIILPRNDPAQNHLSAALAFGPLQRGAPDRLALILKATYVLGTPEAGAVRPALPAAAPEPVAAADEPRSGFGTGAQCELALRKERCDLIAAGWLAAPQAQSRGMEGHIRVAGSAWLTRATPDKTQAPQDEDAISNLFGWQPRALAPRRLAPNPPENDPQLPAGYTPAFENGYRRSTAGPSFATPGNLNTGAVPSAAVIELAQWVHGDQGNALTYLLRTPADPGYTAQLRTWCGHGPDKDRHWRVAARIKLRCDTLIVHPSAHRAVLLWRCDWDRTLEPPTNWRAVQILEGGA